MWMTATTRLPFGETVVPKMPAEGMLDENRICPTAGQPPITVRNESLAEQRLSCEAIKRPILRSSSE